jgi:hypothetical protein
MLLVSVVCLYFSRHWISAAFSPYFSHPVPAPLIQKEAPQPPASQPAVEQNQTIMPLQPEVVQETPAEVNPPEPEPMGGMRLEFEVYQECWVSLRSDGNQVLSRILQPGSSESFKASENFFLILGNAGGVRLTINGEPIKSLGKPGEVVRVLINEQNIKDLLEKSAGS